VRAVVDASVVVKWVFPSSAAEDNTDEALMLLRSIKGGSIALIQPPHWLAETAAVVTRLNPQSVEPALDLLDAVDFPISDELAVFKKAAQISLQLNHHLFDTLYHAVALENGCTLVTADDRYYLKARRIGSIVRLRFWSKLARTESAGRADS
jgi:predicted nucleic acid-binding protein